MELARGILIKKYPLICFPFHFCVICLKDLELDIRLYKEIINWAGKDLKKLSPVFVCGWLVNMVFTVNGSRKKIGIN